MGYTCYSAGPNRRKWHGPVRPFSPLNRSRGASSLFTGARLAGRFRPTGGEWLGKEMPGSKPWRWGTGDGRPEKRWRALARGSWSGGELKRRSLRWQRSTSVAGGGWCRGGPHDRGRQSASARTVYAEVWQLDLTEACSGSAGGERDISRALVARRLTVAVLSVA
jgi:hypothetical protein